MTLKQTTFAIVALAVASSLLLTSCQAKEQQPAAQPQQQQPSLASRLLSTQQTRTRTARSLSDYFEKVKSKIFGNKKQSASASSTQQQVQPAASVNSAQRQPWDVSIELCHSLLTTR